MPFTPSHALVALPFVRTPLAPAAVAVGAMAPDLPLFVRGTPLDYGWTHDPAWLPATVVLAFALLLLWRCVPRPAARELAPAAIADRLPPEWNAGAAAAARETLARRGRDQVSLGGVLLLAAALAIGVASHIAWDAFSHVGRAGVAWVPGLGEPWGPLPGYKWVQHGSGVVGLVVLAVSALLWLRRARVVRASRRSPGWMPWAWLAALPLLLVVGWGVGLVVFGPLTDEFTAAHLAYRVLPPACAVWGVLTILLCIAVQVTRTGRRLAE